MAPRHSPNPLRAACVQIDASDDWRGNLETARKKMRLALAQGARLVTFPETLFWRGPSRRNSEIANEVTPRVVAEFREAAEKNKVHILLGSVLEASSLKNKFYNTSVLISDQGEIISRYRKIHLFDVGLKDVRVRESRHIVPGRKIASGRVGNILAGLTVCYDLRFPELFRRLSQSGCRMIFVPANFTYETGKSHWEILLRARAIENQVFIVAPAQVGTHPSTGIRSFGASLMIDPWGNVLAKASRVRQEVIVADLDFGFQARLRRSFPVLRHRRL